MNAFVNELMYAYFISEHEAQVYFLGHSFCNVTIELKRDRIE